MGELIKYLTTQFHFKSKKYMIIRILDFSIASIAFILLIPLFTVIILVLVLSSGFPIFFIQARVGKKETMFNFLKFRTMNVINSANNGDSTDYFGMDIAELKKIRLKYITTTKNDTRVTSFGKFLRKYSLDELPQLFNVVFGNMSLVGPRPDPPIQRADYSQIQWLERCKVKPGLTGFAQIKGRSESTGEERIMNDLFWVRNMSLVLYLKILLLTPIVLLKNTN